MKAIIVASKRSDHQTSWAGAFAAGLSRHGVAAELSEWADGSCDLLVLWSVRKQDAIRRQKARGGEVCIMERGYLGDRFHWTSVSFGGGLNGRGQFRGTTADPERFHRHFGQLRPWQINAGGHALIMGQVPGDMSLAGRDIGRWYQDTASELLARGYTVRFRSHPVATERGYRAPVLPGVKHVDGSLTDALAGAAIVATFNSNAAVDAVLAGVPATAADEGSMAWDVTARKPGEVVMTDRAEWAARLAWKQWTLEEIASGECWDRIKSA